MMSSAIPNMPTRGSGQCSCGGGWSWWPAGMNARGTFWYACGPWIWSICCSSACVCNHRASAALPRTL
eukprot:992040-Heterocapsa_arctica.AAC.1